MKDFFISYNKADRTWAEWIAWQLEEAKYSVFLQAWDFRPGGNFVADMQQGATTAKRTIAVLSEDYLGAKFTQPEWQAAFAQDPTGAKGILLPVRVAECDPRGLLGPIIYIDLVDITEDAARTALLAGVKRERAKPKTAPSFPEPGTRVVREQPDFPSPLPSIWNVPRRNPNFTGRAELLADLRKALTSGKPAALTQAIHGLGGIGKTQLAREYSYRHAADYRLVWWIQSEEPAKLASDFAGLAHELDLREKDAQEQGVIVDAVCRWLNQNSGWLLVFDNVPHPGDVREYLPANPAGHVIVTSRDRNWRDVASPLEVTKMARPDSVDFLLRRTGLDDKEAADNLAAMLDDFPLLLEQAGSYIVERGLSFTEYIGRFEQRQAEMLGRGSGSQDYTESTATVWEVSFQAVEEESEAAAQLLYLCAFLAPDDIPCEMITDGAEHLPEPLAGAVKDPLAFDDVVAALHSYSLVDKGDGALSVHRLVQAVTRDRLPETEVKKWLRAGLEIVNAAFPYDSDDVRFWPQCARLLPHVTTVTDHSAAETAAPDAAGRLLNQAGLYLEGRAEFARARDSYERALAIAERAYGPDHPTVAIRVNNLGSVLKALGDLAGAKACYERALAIHERAYGPDHPTVAISVNNLGDVLQDLGDLSGAKAHCERALAIDEKAYGPDHPEVARDVNNLGLVLQALGDLAGAKAHFERALAILRKFLGDEHPTTVIVLGNLESLGSKS